MSSAWIENAQETEVDKTFEDNFIALEDNNKKEFSKLADSSQYLANLGN